ncbi:WD40 repeat-like protein [Gyrodon lividus]|nr:WD40 repeat-like protein [Gyrodon lividus]
MSLALDSTTQLEGRAAPEGILYTGGRDGQVISWDLGLPFRRMLPSRRGRVVRWEMLTGMADETLDEETEEEERRDGDVLGDVKESGGRRRRSSMHHDIPYERQWELALERLEFATQAQFRQSAQMHTDWINDILLCNYNQTVISASSDGTIKSWNPHSNPSMDPSIIGTHADYARCLAFCPEPNWIVSGSFDRTIKLWDLTRSSSPHQSLLTLNPPDTTAPKASVYALAADPCGHAIASGSPERVIRMWDPRSGKRTGKLVGHTDNIRAILISEDARYLLTGSADASIKLWSLSSQRCLHTFTYHTDSVWSLYSTHPSLEVFYSGDKSGILCKVDVEDCSEVADGVCIVLARESSEEAGEGINKIVTADDGLLWTASGSSSIGRWKVPKRSSRRNTDEDRALFADSPVATITRRRVSVGTEPTWSGPPSIHQGKCRRDDELPSYPGVPLSSLVRLTSPNGPFSPSSFMSRGRDAEIATLYSAASIVSVPGARSAFNTAFQHSAALMPSNALKSMRSEASMSNIDQDPAHDTHTACTAYELRELASEAVPHNTAPDSVIAGSRGLVRAILLNDRMHALTVDTRGDVAVWDIVRGICQGWYTREDVRAASRCGSMNGSARSRGNSSAAGDKDRSPREALEAVRERIEGEAVVSAWSSVDTKTGVLTVHISERCFDAEIYADEAGFDPDKHFNDELRFNIGKWVLRNLFIGFIREEQRVRRKRDAQAPDSSQHDHSNTYHRVAPTHIDLNGNSSSSPGRRSPSETSSRSSPRTPICTAVITSATALPAVIPALHLTTKSSPLLTPMISLKVTRPLDAIPQSPSPSDGKTSIPRPIRTHGLDIPPPSASREIDYFSAPVRRPSTAGTALSDGDFPAWGGLGSPPRHAAESSVPITPSTPGGGFIGRLKNFGKGPSRKVMGDTVPGSPITTTAGNPTDTPTVPEELVSGVTKTTAQILLSNSISPPSSSEAPTLPLPPNMTVMMSDESYPGWKTVYQGSVSTTWADIYTLEETMPLWLLEYVLFNKVIAPHAIKISFVLLPWPNPDPDGEQLPELLNIAQSKLTASRFLRVRKLACHVQDKLERRISSGANFAAPSPVDTPTPGSPCTKSHRARAEENYEILCNDSVLSLDMTLAAVRQYLWKQSSELIMYYRLRKRPAAQNNADVPTLRAM